MIYVNELLRVDYYTKGYSETFDYHSHQEYEIYFFHAGMCRYLIHNQIYDLEPGDILLMDGMTLHKPNVNPDSEYIRSIIHFSPLWIKGLLKDLDSVSLLNAFENRHHCLIRTKENRESVEIAGFIRRLSDVINLPEKSNVRKEAELKILLVQILMMLQKIIKPETVVSSSEKPEKAEHVENIVTYIQSNYMHKLNLDKIANALNLSKSYMSHLFKEMTGFTIMEYVMDYRLTQVKYLLEVEPSTPLKDIARKSGFESAAHFSRYFRNQMGMTASDYRRFRLNNKQ